MAASYTDNRHLPIQFYCNGIKETVVRRRHREKKSLSYYENEQCNRNMTLKLSDFVQQVVYLPDRVLDLLEIAAYVFCADRSVRRGARDDLHYQSWSRNIEYNIRVRDYDFWHNEKIRKLLAQTVTWITGDMAHKFYFYPGHKTEKTSLFDHSQFVDSLEGSNVVMLFSGGLDSLAGTIKLLEETQATLWLVSHKSSQITTRTQYRLVEALKKQYLPKRINHSFFECHLHKDRAPEESQRTRAFLYTSAAFAMSSALKLNSFYLYENAITALNFPKRGAMINARVSRTAHPKTIRLLESLFHEIGQDKCNIVNPFKEKTKTDIVECIHKYDKLHLANSSVSCSKIFKGNNSSTHCGCCSQCIDRRFAFHALNCESFDEGIYSFDFINEPITDGETKTNIIDYIRQAREFLHSNEDSFYIDKADLLSEVIDHKLDEFAQVSRISDVCKRHGKQVQKALVNMIHPLEYYPEGSLFTLIKTGDYERAPVYTLAKQIANELEVFIRKTYSLSKPKNENELNASINGYLSGHGTRFENEHPTLKFGTARTIPDHSCQDMLVEVKYIRTNTTPSKANEGIAADLTKYPDEPLKLFIVYDPYSQITDRNEFRRDFEVKRHCIIHII